MIQNFGYRSKNGKRNWVSALLSSDMHYLSLYMLITGLLKDNRIFYFGDYTEIIGYLSKVMKQGIVTVMLCIIKRLTMLLI